MSNTRALILAAGRGSRMGNATSEKPKCLNMIAGETLLEWQIQSLRGAGIDKVGVLRGYKAEMITIADFYYQNPKWSETNMVYSLFCAEPSEGDTIISYSDITYHPDHVKKLMETEGDIVITADLEWKSLWEDRFENPLDDAESFITKDGNLIEIGKKTDNYANIQAQYMGLMKLTSKGWAVMKELFLSLPEERKRKLDMTSTLNLLLEKGVKINVAFIQGKWCEADTQEDIEVYHRRMNEEKKWIHDWR